MKKLTNSLLILLTASVVMFSCGDDESPKNQFTAEGEAYALAKGYTVLAEQGEDDNGDDIYLHYVYLTSKDLDVEVDGGFDLSGEGNLFGFGLITSEDEIEAGTYEFGDDEEAGVVAEALVFANIDISDESYDKRFVPTEGTIKVSKSGNKTKFTINITGFTVLDEEGNPETGEGSLKGNFNGKLTVLEIEEEPLARLKDSKNPFTELLNF